MFDGVPGEQLHQFIASSRTCSLPLPLPLSSFPLHANSSPNTFSINNSFDDYNTHHHHHHHHQQLPLQPPPHELLQPLHHQYPPAHKNHDHDKQENNLVSVNERDRSVSILEPINAPWTNDEVLALLRVRSTMENWFPDFTWEHISGKLAELGFKRSAEKCKEKFEEESRYFNNINYMKNSRFLSELEEVYSGEQNPQEIILGAAEKSQKVVEKPSHESFGEDKRGQSVENDQTAGKDSEEDDQIVIVERLKNSKKRKRSHKNFEIFKGFCEEIVNRMMAQHEEMHNKLLEDMVKRDEEKAAKEEAWKKQVMVRMNKELELMAHQQAIAGDRQSTIIELLKKFTSSSTSSSEETQHCSGGSKNENHSLKLLNSSSSNPIPHTPSSSSIQAVQKPSPTCLLEEPQGQQNSHTTDPTPSKSLVPQSPSSTDLTPTTPKLPTTSSPLASQNPNSLDKPFTPTSSSVQRVPHQNPTSNEKDDLGKRWPRDEVLALINLRCSLYSNNEDKEGVKAPLWERISLGMLDLGYKRSAKRCKEKWENINKYFRKTKDANKKRSMDSRTCPYFHQLSTLYNQGKVLAAPDSQEQQPATAALPETCRGSSQVIVGSSTDSFLHVINGDHHQGETNMVQVSAALDFDF